MSRDNYRLLYSLYFSSIEYTPRLEEIQEILKMMSEEDKDNLIQLLLNEKKKVENDNDLLKLSNNFKCPPLSIYKDKQKWDFKP